MCMHVLKSKREENINCIEKSERNDVFVAFIEGKSMKVEERGEGLGRAV